jgi:hypothetical protein
MCSRLSSKDSETRYNHTKWVGVAHNRRALAAEFLKQDCAGARGLSETTKEKLKDLAATAHP